MTTRALGFLQDIPVDIVVELGRARMTLRELAELEREDVIELDRGEGEPLDLVAGGRVIARAAVVQVGDRTALRIVEVAGEPARSAG